MNRSKGIWQLLGALAGAVRGAAVRRAERSGNAARRCGISFGNRWVTTWSAAQQQPGPDDHRCSLRQ